MIIDVVLSRGLIEPRELPALLRAVEAHVPAGGTEGVVLSGRLPVWAFAALAHLYHPRPWVATFDPRLGGAVVVTRHVDNAPEVGAVVPVDGAASVQVEF
jgi:CRISPR-associated Csx3 family protein